MHNDDVLQAKLINTNYYSIGFPNEVWESLINRDNYLSQIECYFYEDAKIIFLEGDEDSGKTTLCAQFARRNVDKTISVFFNPNNILDYNIEFYYSNVVLQIKYLIKEEIELDERESYANVEQYNQYVFQLRKLLKKKNDKIYVIIDGLDSKTKENISFIKTLFEVLPIGQDIFRIIISGYQCDYLSICPKLKKQTVKIVSLTGFSPLEIIKYLEIEDTSESEIKDLFKITKGFPGRLKTLKRLMQNENYSLDKIDKSTSYLSWIELDCESVDLSIPKVKVIISLLALYDKAFTFENIAKICSIELDETKEILSEIIVVESSGSYIAFVSNAHKKYFANLQRMEKKSTDDLLEQYYSNEDTINAKFELSRIYSEKKQWSKIIDLIDETYVQNILESTGTLQIANESLELGVHASEMMNKYAEMWRYSVQGSIVNELDNYLFWESEIEARISLHDFVGAISLAESSVLKVDRLRLLALIARRQKEVKKSVDEDLINLIQELYKSTDITSVGDKIYDIVADLIYAIPNLAIEIIEKSSGAASEKSINDWVIAKLSIAAIDSNLKENDNTTNLKKIEVLENLNNPSVRKINRAISFLVGNYTANKVLDEVNKLSDHTEKLRLLRLWLNNNHRNIKDIDKVIGIALDELILATTESTITLDVLKELSFQLPYIKDSALKKELLKRFQSIEGDLQDLGLTKNSYIYKLNIFQTQFTLDRKSSFPFLNSILKEIDSLKDPLIKLESYAEVYSKLNTLNDTEFKDILKLVYNRILGLSDELFLTTASHFTVCQTVLKTIGKKNPVLGLKICEHINTLYRRENSRFVVLDSYLLNNLKFIKIELLREFETSFEIFSSLDTFYARILERYAEAKSLHFDTIKSLLTFISKVDSFSNPSERTYAYVLAYRILVKNDSWKERLSIKFENKILNSWKDIEADWKRIDNGFAICSALTLINEEFAQKIFQETEQLKKNSWLDSQLVAVTYINSLKLILRAYSGLVISGTHEKNDFEIIENLIGRVPSESEKLNLWTQIGINMLQNECEDLTKKIYNDHILPLTQSLLDKKNSLHFDFFILVHKYNSELALEYFKKVPLEFHDKIISTICNFYITKRSPFEIYDSEEIHKYNITYSDLSKAISLINMLSTDFYLYSQIDNVCKAIMNNKSLITKPQQTDLIEKLKDIVNSKLPDKKNIRHDGYKILAKVKIALVKKENINWKEVIKETDAVNNISDKIFIKANLLENIINEKINLSDTKKILIDDIIKSLESLTIHYEYVQRVIDISNMMYKCDRNRWKEIVNRAFSISDELNDGSEIYSSKKSIIDTMYRLDPSFAKDLIKTLDKENKENRIAKLISDYYDTLEISTKIKNNQNLEQKEKENYRVIVKGVLKALAALNSDKILTKKISEVSTFLPIGNKLPLHEVFPIYMYYLTNCSRTYKDGSMAEIHRQNFIETVNSINLIQVLSQRRKYSEKSYRNFFIDEEFITNKAVKPNSREEALSMIKNWLTEEMEDFIYIIDPYFTKEDLEILKIIKETGKVVDIEILGSGDGLKMNIEDSYKEYWKKITDEIVPFTNITFCWNQEDNNSSPFHDRWLITKNSGLRLGTSINSLGIKKDSELSIMKPNEALNILENNIKDYLTRRKREINNQRLSYKSFSL